MLYSNISDIVYSFGLIMLFDKWHYCQLSWYFRETNITRVLCKHHDTMIEQTSWGLLQVFIGARGCELLHQMQMLCFFYHDIQTLQCVMILINNQTTQKSLSLSVNLIVTNKYYLRCMSLSLRLLFKHNCHCLSTWQT